jgi:proline dehydrogenase
VRALCALEAPVRLVKGAYQEPDEVAYLSKREVDESFARLLEVLVECASPLAVATHDAAMIERAKSLARARVPAAAGLGGDAADEAASHEFGNPPFEFQLLYGVRRDLQEKLLKEGYEVRVYVPYGTEWYAYLLRRLAERPANLLFIVRSVVREFFRR